MSEVQQKGRKAEHELALTAAAHAKHRAECIEAAVELAKRGAKDEAYTKLLMVVAIDSVRALVHEHVDSATMDKAGEQASHPNN